MRAQLQVKDGDLLPAIERQTDSCLLLAMEQSEAGKQFLTEYRPAFEGLAEE